MQIATGYITMLPIQNEPCCIVSLDKDMLSIPGLHYSWRIEGEVKGKKWVKEAKFTLVDELEGLRHFYEQCLKGDKADNVKGVEGLGEKKAQKILERCETELEMLNTCLWHYPSEEEFLMNAQCLYILRSFDDSYLTRYERLLNESDSDKV